MARGRLPAALNDRLEQHPRLQALLVEHGVTPERRVELIERLNAISATTGIVVRPDEESSVPE